MRAADLPVIASAVRSKDEGAFLGADEDSDFVHRFLSLYRELEMLGSNILPCHDWGSVGVHPEGKRGA